MLDAVKIGVGTVLTTWGLGMILAVLVPKIQEALPEKPSTQDISKAIINRILEEVRKELRDQRPLPS